MPLSIGELAESVGKLFDGALEGGADDGVGETVAFFTGAGGAFGFAVAARGFGASAFFGAGFFAAGRGFGDGFFAAAFSGFFAAAFAGFFTAAFGGDAFFGAGFFAARGFGFGCFCFVAMLHLSPRRYILGPLSY